ncbi:DinB family protein [Psychroserpens sp. MEBiC05023]
MNSSKLLNLIEQISEYVFETSEDKISRKINPEKWSKKEILGHLVDSGINNLQLFTEIEFKEKPYQLRSYNQDKLVQVNNYQDSETKDILDLLIAINKRIIAVVSFKNNKTLNHEIITYDSKKLDFKYLIEDYIKHFEHHTKQIIE